VCSHAAIVACILSCSTTLEPKYERMMVEAEVRRQVNREGRLAELAG
jgi:hypothetical protein